MLEISALEAKDELASLLDQVEREGIEITITRRGRAIAKLVPAIEESPRHAALAAADRILQRSKGVSLGGLPLKQLVEEGRR